MDSPFIYSKPVTGKNFIGRKQDCVILGNLISQGEHVVLYEPPRSGKTSLVRQALLNMRMAGTQVVPGQFSVLNIRSVEDFLIRLGSTLVRMVASTPDEYGEIVSQYLGGTHFVFDRTAFSETDTVLSLTWDLEPGDMDAVLRLPFRLAADKGQRMLLIITEFQNITLFDGGDTLLRRFAAVLKEARDSGDRGFSYILSGSSVNAMKDIFENGFAFSRIVERVKLSGVDEKEIADHIHKGFLTGGKVTNKDLLLGASKLLGNNLCYINHFAAICDSMSKGYIMEPVLNDALDCLIAMHEPCFRERMNNLTTHQVSLLRAVVDGVTKFSASEVIRKYGLNSSANVKRVKDALMKKEILEFDRQDIPHFLDPLMEYWVKKYFFETEKG